jgi:hypothetical protein
LSFNFFTLQHAAQTIFWLLQCVFSFIKFNIHGPVHRSMNQ